MPKSQSLMLGYGSVGFEAEAVAGFGEVLSM
jgi:hypothetical protein